MLFVLQNNLGKTTDITKLSDFLEIHKIPWTHIAVIPFDDSPLENIPKSDVTVFYGSTGLTHRVHKENKWNPGVWFKPENFEFTSLKAGFQKNLLNYDSEVITVEELLNRPYQENDVFFLRPVEDDKTFTGSLFTFKEAIEAWKDKLFDSNCRLQYHTQIQLATPRVILREMRSFVVDGVVSTSSYYGHGMMRQEVSEEDIAFAQKMAELYQPAKVFTLDTCTLEDGTKKVVETNCFNSSGFYWTDIWKLVKDIKAFMEKEYGT